MRRVGLWMVATGICVALVGLVSTWSLIGRALTADTHAVPGTFRETLDRGTYMISVQTGSGQSAGPVTVRQSQSVAVEGLRITGPDGQDVPTRSPGNEYVRRGDARFTGIARFHAPTDGTYVIELTTTRPTKALVTRPLGDATITEWVGLAAVSVGSIAAFVGAILAIVGWVKRRDVRRAAASADSSLPPPPGHPG